jgi:hypothetical protein
MKKILALINIIIPIISFILLFFFDYSDNIIYIILMTLFIGWIIPYLNLLITGIAILNDSHYKLARIFNIFSIILNIVIIFFIISLYEKKFLLMIIEYSIFIVISIINVIYFHKKVKSDTTESEEDQEIKKIKKETDGVIK